MAKQRTHIMVCGGTGCVSSQSLEIVDKFKEVLIEKDYQDEIAVIKTGCFGFCGQGPIVKIHPDNVFYVKVTLDDVREIVEEHIIKGRTVGRLLYKEPETKKTLPKHDDMGFYKKQYRIALRNCGLINPEDINEYIAFSGYEALGKAVTELSPDQVIDLVKTSGLRGRGGGGFSTGLKWELTRKPPADEKYVICNADEGDPGAFMDRSILEGDPHSVIEAMAIAGYAIGASNGIVYIRAEYPLAIKRLEIALSQARDYGLLGKDIFESGFNFDIEIKLGAGAFVCGEETALIHSVEGNRGEPTKKPPYPSVEGYQKKPTSVNNVETFANVPPIVLKGAEWFQSIGTEKSKGTKVFALAGKVNNVGLVEVPMGTTLREIIYDIGGGIIDGKAFKAVQTGGPSGGVITALDLDTPIDYESLKAIGSMMGSGGMIVMDEDDCMVNIAKFYLDFTQDESCGKCTPCRLGTKRMYEILEKITEGKGTMEDIDKLRSLGQTIKDSALCGLGQTAPNPVLSTLEYFYDEYLSHIVDKKCPAGACKALSKYKIDPEKCIGCTACARVCPVNCIEGKPKEVHIIDESLCIACGACYTACRFDAVIKP
ncbi:NADH-ubiquinone oxidoreductase-F iron-sulfur binding region domain-containing protein [Fusibacter tunisiensis]|uniref:NADH:ubiquinone oxidoreductase subunit F (NADH-binding)/(2Fe-2S) ferredoxin/NAD-dependent dihydropyrimidine dehydrogenase PreA subunit n=1 Tax=Fusibacter tunisiensis TaxID=1008308 RepID=A0ABS2MRJ8_9FIRM|nr:NADH-ubiquinone oxidoreductase-F iron-sulfur binding region domain-containing protein [Fusibacter tunisiensis]MBM7562041.1 NADH:ubiquinone oxidoreductase subunit F (NADH-binding)/(2Fe-2S) ferredoxin/NAD-dependent dihydropyrimidine dehydrogenase PreA subunit [Fusibacter tunisiensis]